MANVKVFCRQTDRAKLYASDLSMGGGGGGGGGHKINLSSIPLELVAYEIACGKSDLELIA